MIGKRNSSKTRVDPVFSRIMSDPGLVKKLLSLLNYSHPQYLNPQIETQSVKKIYFDSVENGFAEKKLDPPLSLLRHLVQNLGTYAPQIKGSGSTEEKRRFLCGGDEKTIDEGLELLGTGNWKKQWYALEGQTCPDVYFETESLIIVIEGKRTEHGATKHTSWMPIRHQMLRHIDCAWEIRGNKKVLGFFIVEGDSDSGGLTDHWISECTDTISHEAICGSLPHRSEGERQRIASCFAGATTWQKVCKEFEIPWDEIARLTVLPKSP